MSGYTNGYGAGDYEFMLLTLSEEFETCGSLIEHVIALQILDVTSHANVVFQNIAFTEDFSYSASIPYNTVTPTVSDTMLQISSQIGKEICTLVGQTI